jgi:hypothetical protein
LQNQLIRAASSPSNANDDDDGGADTQKKETDEVQLRRDGALNQFISELSSNIHGRRYSEVPNATSNNNSNQNDNSNKQASAVESKSDSNDKMEQNSTIENNNDKVSDNSTANESERRKSDLLAQPSHFVTVIEVKESSASSSSPETASTTTNSTSSPSTAAITTSTSSFKAIRSGYENVIIENNKRNSNLMNEMDRSSSNTTSFNSVRPSAPPIALLQDAKKKIPPR